MPNAPVPLHILWSTRAHGAFDHVEVQHQVQRRDNHHKKAEANADDSASVNGRHLNMKKSAKNHLYNVEHCDSAGGGNHAHLEALRGANNASLVSQ